MESAEIVEVFLTGVTTERVSVLETTLPLMECILWKRLSGLLTGTGECGIVSVCFYDGEVSFCESEKTVRRRNR
ncbi:MAG: hypothetical protein II711_00695 [Clostridia bacterium]|nr:hypothetical protein [Clostridia bacterium]